MSTVRMKHFRNARIRLVALGALAAAPQASAALTDYPFRLLTRMQGGEKRLIAENGSAAPVSLRLHLINKRGGRNGIRLTTLVVQPHSSVPVSSLDGIREGTIQYSYYVGRIDATSDNQTRYRLPYADGLAFPITQAYGGRLTSHDNVYSRYAVDFAMPEGTPVVAARAGVVVDVTLEHHSHGLDRSFFHKANRVTIVHDDGTIAEYAHLAARRPLVKRGQRVERGALIAYSGNTGYSSAPHLHFSVSKPAVVEERVTPVSLPILFYTDDRADAFPPVSGMIQRAIYGSRRANAVAALHRMSDRSSKAASD